MSKLDRFLLSATWCDTWPNCIQTALQRDLSDHVPVVLLSDVTNWGPRSFRMMKRWADYPGYADFIRDKWRTFNVEGWGGFVLKQKLKMIKQCLEDWHQQQSKNLRVGQQDYGGEASNFFP